MRAENLQQDACTTTTAGGGAAADSNTAVPPLSRPSIVAEHARVCASSLAPPSDGGPGSPGKPDQVPSLHSVWWRPGAEVADAAAAGQVVD